MSPIVEAEGTPQPTAHIHKLYGTGDSNALKAAYARTVCWRGDCSNAVCATSVLCASRASGIDGLLTGTRIAHRRPITSVIADF